MVTFSPPNGSGRLGCHAVVQAANDRLSNNANMPVQRVFCEYEQGFLLLRGRLPSYYQKQLAQEAVKGLDGVRQVVNEIEVVG